MFQRILVPLDGSPRAERALPVAARIAQASAGSVVLLQVISPPVDCSGGLAPAPLITEQLFETELAEATSYLTTMTQSEQLREIPTQTEVRFGLPVPHILGVVESQAVDLIVLCSHGRTGFTRWVLGSVAQRVIHHSPVPVLVLREGGPALPEAGTATAHPLCAVVALDGSPLAETALLPAAHLVAALAAPLQATLHVMHVIKPLASATDEGVSPQDDAEAVEQAQAYLVSVREYLLERASDLNLTVTWSVTRASDVAQAIITTAEQAAGVARGSTCDLLVTATHGRGGLERWVMGSVTERVLEGTKLPMLVVRPSQTSAHQEKAKGEERTHAAR